MIDENKKLQQLSTFTWKETKSNEEERKIKEQKKKGRKLKR
ncbi:hypothetical protein [Bacillus cereus]|nr:hypothetical protein [Bacillus cereus]